MERLNESNDGNERLMDLDETMLVDAEAAVDDLVSGRSFSESHRKALVSLYSFTQKLLKALIEFEPSEEVMNLVPREKGYFLSDTVLEDIARIRKFYYELGKDLEAATVVMQNGLQDPMKPEFVEVFIKLSRKMREAAKVADAVKSEGTSNDWHQGLILNASRDSKFNEADMNRALTKQILLKGGDKGLYFNLKKILLAAKVNLHGWTESVASQMIDIESKNSDRGIIREIISDVGLELDGDFKDYEIITDPRGLRTLIALLNRSLRMMKTCYELDSVLSELVKGSSNS